MTQIETAYRLIKEKHLDQASSTLDELLSNDPKDAGAWALKTLVAPDLEQREQCLRQVFEHSKDTALANWSFEQLKQIQAGSPPEPETDLPLESIMVYRYTQIAATGHTEAGTISSVADPVRTVEMPVSIPAKNTPRRISVKRIGVWIALAGGLVIVVPGFSPSIITLLIQIGVPLGWGLYCGFPLILIGALVLVVGLFVDKKQRR
jgi:hypothetical protein